MVSRSAWVALDAGSTGFSTCTAAEPSCPQTRRWSSGAPPSHLPYLMAFSRSSAAIMAKVWQPCMSAKMAVKQLRIEMRSRSTLDHSLRTGRSIRKLNRGSAFMVPSPIKEVFASRIEYPQSRYSGAQRKQGPIAKNAQYVEVHALPLQRGVVVDLGADLLGRRFLEQLDDGCERRRVEMLELLEVQLDGRLALGGLVENVHEEGRQHTARLALVAPPPPHELHRRGAAIVEDFDSQIT